MPYQRSAMRPGYFDPLRYSAYGAGNPFSPVPTMIGGGSRPPVGASPVPYGQTPMGIPGLEPVGQDGGAMKGLGNFLRENWQDLAGLGLGAYGAYQQGRAQDREFDENKRRYEDERRRRSGAAATTAPFVEGMIQQLQDEIARQAQGK